MVLPGEVHPSAAFKPGRGYFKGSSETCGFSSRWAMVWPGECIHLLPSIPAVAGEGKLWDMRFQLQVGHNSAR